MNEEIVIDGEGAILGRLCSLAAKKSLQGSKIIVVNCEKTLISGNRENILKKYLDLKKMGGSSQKGPIFSKNCEKIVKRTIRGMLPGHDKGRGEEALKKIRCYKGVPEEYKEAKKITIDKGIKNKYITLNKVESYIQSGK